MSMFGTWLRHRFRARTNRKPEPVRMGAPSPVPQDAASPEWRQPVTRVLEFVEARSLVVVGITSNRRAAGVSRLAGEIASVAGSYGRRVLLIDASRLAVEPDDRPESDGLISFDNVIARSSERLAVADISQLGPLPANSSKLRKSIDKLAESYDLVVVDLPPAVQPDQKPDATFLAVGGACAATLLVCMTGEMTTGELATCLAGCSIAGVAVAGLVLNDQQMAASRLLADG